MPNKVFELVESMFVSHLVQQKDFTLFVAKDELPTNALEAKAQMKSSLYDVIRSNNDFSNASVAAFAFGGDWEYCIELRGTLAHISGWLGKQYGILLLLDQQAS